MSIIDLIQSAGIENVRVQFLNEHIVGARIVKSAGGATEVRFMTNSITPSELIGESRQIGVIVWIPRESWPTPKPPA